MSQGSFAETNNPLDLVIEGRGFFQVRRPSGELAYTLDSIATTTTTTPYGDLMLGGRVALPVGRPVWLIGTAHVMSGTETAGNGVAGFAAIGAKLGRFELQAGLAGMRLYGNGGLTGSLRAGVTNDQLTGWLELDVQDISTGQSATTHVGGAGGLAIHRNKLALDLEALVGDRAYAVIDNGTLVESVGDTFHTTGRALLRYDVAPYLHPYLGASARSATTITSTTSTDYNVFTGFAGLSLSF